MFWFVTLSLVSAYDSDMSSFDSRAIHEPSYRIQITGAGVRRDYVRPVKDAAIVDAMESLPQELIPKLTIARIGVIRGTRILEVDWRQIVLNGATATNYQLYDGDIIVVEIRGTGQ
jgi:hypothetical protein